MDLKESLSDRNTDGQGKNADKKNLLIISAIISIVLIIGGGVALSGILHMKRNTSFIEPESREADQNVLLEDVADVLKYVGSDTEFLNCTNTQSLSDSVKNSLGMYLLEEVVYEMGDEPPSPVEFFDFSRTSMGDLSGLNVQLLQFATELSDEMLHKKGKYSVGIGYEGIILDGHLTVEDTTPPQISVPDHMEYFIGDTILYKKNVEVTDNSGEIPELSVDNSAVMANMAGTYKVYYKAVDSYGNVGKAESEIIIRREHIPTQTEAETLADELLEEILEENMNKAEKARAIFDWCHDNIRYAPDADKNGIWQSAYDGFHYRTGDCYTYFATASYLLERSGIDHFSVSRKGEYATHYWSLVNVGDGWYHYDCSPHKKGYKCFMQTDSQVAKYAAEYENDEAYFVFDEEGMPARSDIVLFVD